MKKNTSTKIIRRALGTLKLYRCNVVFCGAMLAFSSLSGLHAQVNSGARSTTINIDDIAGQKNNEMQRLSSLAGDLHPSVYYLNNEIKTYGEKPVVFFSDVQGLKNIGSAALKKIQLDGIEMVNVKINKPSELTTVDGSLLRLFPNLKFVFVVATFATTPEQITSMFRNMENYTLVYNIATPR